MSKLPRRFIKREVLELLLDHAGIDVRVWEVDETGMMTGITADLEPEGVEAIEAAAAMVHGMEAF